MAVLKALPQQHPLAAVLRGSRDAANADAIADALLNPRDRAYSVPQVFDFIERNGLRLRRWYWQAPYLPQCGAIATTPHAARLSALPAREQFAALELWRGRSQLSAWWRHRSGRRTRRSVRFDPERCSTTSRCGSPRPSASRSACPLARPPSCSTGATRSPT